MTRKQPFSKLEQLLLSIPTWIFVSVAVGLIGYLSLWVHEDHNSKSKCNTSGFLFKYTELVCDGASVLLQSAESIAIVAAVILYFKEIPDRKAQKHYKAWQVIDNAAAAQSSTSYARKQALEDLARDRVSLRSLDVPNADLNGVNLCNADLREADLRKAELRDANLSNANLQNANLCNADLRDANLREADLKGANLREANLKNADIFGADLSGASFGNGLPIEYARSSSASDKAHDIREAKRLSTSKQIQLAKNWRAAMCNGTRLDDPEVSRQLGLDAEP
jgi:BTB/POZ domain-containing protein KCTD9